jgi:hypothetical protein
MGVTDIIIAAAILAGAVYLMYHSMWKKKGHCQGCGDGGCAGGKGKRTIQSRGLNSAKSEVKGEKSPRSLA